MGEARARRQAGLGPQNGDNGHPVVRGKRIRVVREIKLQNVDADRVVMLLLGEREPELATALSPFDARKLAEALVKHAEALERDAPRVIIPGFTPAPPPPGGRPS